MSVQSILIGPRASDVRYRVCTPGADADTSAEWRLVSTSMTVRFDGVPPTARVVQVPKSALPFGLLHSIKLQAAALKAAESVQLEVVKYTGQGAASFHAPQWRVAVGDGDFANAQDAVDDDLATLKRETGHVMAWRMIAGGGIGDMTLKFTEAPPSAFELVFNGANAVRLADATATTPRLLLAPMTPAQRLAQLATR